MKYASRYQREVIWTNNSTDIFINILRWEATDNGDVYMIFEYMEFDLSGLMDVDIRAKVTVAQE